MKVAFFIDDFPSFTQTFVLRQMAGVIEIGWPVAIYAHRDSGLKVSHPLIDEHGMMGKTIYLPKVPRSRWQRLGGSLALCRGADWLKNLRTLIKALNFVQYGREAVSLKLANRCLPFVDDGRFDILHAQFGWMGARVCSLRQVGALSGKVVTAFRGYDTGQYLAKYPGAYRHLFKHGDLFLPVCNYFKQWLVDNGCAEEKIRVLRSGIDPREFAFTVRKPPVGGPLRLLSVGRLVEKKGLRYALEAIARLVHGGKKIIYTIIGDGPLQHALDQQAVALGIRECLRLPGARPHAAVISEMQQSHILLAPSVVAADGDREGIPNVLKEAMATGMPVLSTRHSGIPELVQDQKSGFLVPEKDVEAIQDRLTVLIDHRDLWEQMGRHGRKIIEDDYDIRILNNRLLELYYWLVFRPDGQSLGSVR